MQRRGEVEPLWWPRLRWRMRGAWQWPAFVVLTLVDGVLLAELPFYGDGPGGFVPGVLLAGFANLFCVAVLAPLLGRSLRPGLPKLIADDYAGTALLVTGTILLLAGGLAHRPAAAAEADARRAVAASVHDYVLAQEAREYGPGLDSIDALRLERALYRACVPGPDPRRSLCLFVSTDQSPPGITRDPDQTPNAAYRP